MRFSEDQLAAIHADGNVIVSAAAGAGKTSVLTERVFRLVQEKNPIDRMLILTFTRAAAAEMKTRIAARLESAALDAETESERKYLRAQAQLCASANISTVHSFCSKVVFRHFFRVGLTPSSKTMDETESSILQQEIRESLLSRYALEKAETYRALIAGFNGESQLIEMSKKICDFLAAEPDPEQWMDRTEHSLQDPDVFQSILAAELELDQRDLARALSELNTQRDQLPLDCEKAFSVLDDILLHARAALLESDRSSYFDVLQGIPISGRLYFPKGMTESETKPVKDAKSKVNKLIRDQIDRYAKSSEALLATQEAGSSLLEQLFAFIRDYLSTYADEKRQRGVIDFNDLEHMTIEILKDDQIAAEYRDRFLYVIIDEYQDSNRVQEAILNRIRRKDNVFFVGDVKQSIYRFRKAEPGLFLEKCRLFSGAEGKRINLKENYRSSQAVIDAVNHVFTPIMREEIAEIEYDEDARLYRKSSDEGGVFEYHVFEKKNDDEEESIADAEAEARFIAQQIRQRMQKPIFDASQQQLRMPKYDDFAILLRTKTNALTYAEAMAYAGIPCYAQLSGGYFDAIEVQLVLNVLRVIDNRRQDIPLLSVLRSPFFSFTDEELVQLRISSKKCPLLDCLLANQDKNPHVCSALNTIAQWRSSARRLSMEELLDSILDSVQFRERMSALPGGAQRVMNLDSLLEKARSFDSSGSSGVHAFLTFMDNAASAADLGASQAVTANVVRIMTVHKSKGLEFPIVYLADLGKQFNQQDQKEPLLLHEKYGAGLSFLDSDGVKRETYNRRLIKQSIADACWAEELRVLYVGMTRAKSELYLLGCVNNAENAVRNLPLPSMETIRSANNAMRLLLLSLNGYKPPVLHSKSETSSVPDAIALPALPAADPEIVSALSEHLAWQYPYRISTQIPTKTSVTDLEDHIMDPFAEMALFDQNSGAAIGSRVHSVLSRLPLRIPEPEELESICEVFGGLPKSHLSSLRWFLSGDLYHRMIHAARVEREWSFVRSVPANDLLDTEQTDPVLLQGVIDACFVENGEWILLDYKTDHVVGDPKEHAQRHKKQVLLYAQALEALTHMPVKEAYVVLLNAKAAVQMLSNQS